MKENRFYIALITAVVLSGIVFFAASRVASDKTDHTGEMSNEIEQKILSFELANYADNGIKKWMLKGDSADILAEVVNLSNIHMVTYDEPKISLTALLGSYDKKNREVSLYKEVVVLTSDGAMLTTDYLKWDGKTDTITTDEPVRMVKGDVVANGVGALAMPQMKKIILDKDIIVELTTKVINDMEPNFGSEGPLGSNTKKPAKVTITCNGPLVIDYEKNIAIFEDNVIVDDKRGKIYSDRMEAFMDPVTKNIFKVVAEGRVRVVRGQDSTYSEKAIYTTADQKIILVGRPRIYISPPDEIEKIKSGFGGI
ncbi:MAG: LPS export ABC transporter periplasmic protein LptC [Candidatus Omnitrophota bacterium]